MSQQNILQRLPLRGRQSYAWLLAPAIALLCAPAEEAAALDVFVGAGDIADCARTQDTATALLLDNVVAEFPSATVFTAGDNAYPSGTTADFNNCYNPTWGRHKAPHAPLSGQPRLR